MDTGIINEPLIPLRQAKSGRAPLVNQALFGETYEIVERERKWTRVRLCHDNTTGWIESRRVHLAVLDPAPPAVVASLYALLSPRDGWDYRQIVAGSLLPRFDPATRHLFLGDDCYALLGPLPGGTITTREELIRHALMYHNAPYLQGGRSPRGIDDAGLVQLLYRLRGLNLPRDLEGQLAAGETLSFIEETLPGDLLFFGDDSRLTHVGIAWEGGRVIHASGRVRVDKVDHHGVFNEELRRYTHSLKVISRVW